MANNYNIMADYIVSKYVERVSGKDLPDIFVEDDPAERVMVGMLAEDRIDTRIVFLIQYVPNVMIRHGTGKTD